VDFEQKTVFLHDGSSIRWYVSDLHSFLLSMHHAYLLSEHTVLTI